MTTKEFVHAVLLAVVAFAIAVGVNQLIEKPKMEWVTAEKK